MINLNHECQQVLKTTDTKIENRLIILICLTILALLIFATSTKWFSGQKFFKISVENLESASQLTIRQTYLIDKKIGVCDEYHFIEINFIGDSDERLKIVTTCRTLNKNFDLISFSIPFQHIYKFPCQNGEFTTDEFTKVYISNHKKDWPKTWNLQRLEFFNTPTMKFEISGASTSIDAKSWLKGQAD